MATTSKPAAARKARSRRFRSSTYGVPTATLRTPSVWSAPRTAVAVVVAGTPTADSMRPAISRSNPGPCSRLPVVHAKTITPTPASASSAAASSRRSELTISSSAAAVTSPRGSRSLENSASTPVGRASWYSAVSEVHVLRSMTPMRPRPP